MKSRKAKRHALHSPGSASTLRERYRKPIGSRIFDEWFADGRFALQSFFRQFSRNAAFVITTMLVVSLGISASVSIFAFVNAALLKPLPYQAPSRLVAAFESTGSSRDGSLSYADYQDWKRSNAVFASLDIWEPDAILWRTAARVESLRIARVSGGFFQTLGVTPLLGRLFAGVDDTPGAPLTVVLPYSSWQTLFGGQSNIVGQVITLDNNAYTVIGVLPRDFVFAPRAAELWVTIHDSGGCDQDRSCRSYGGVARLKDGVSVSAALENMSAVAARLAAQYPNSNLGQGARVIPLGESITGDIRPTLFLLLSGSVLLLLIACVNVASLLLVRAESRRHEMAIRGALGASRVRVLRQLLIEAALLVAISASVGVAGAWALVHSLAGLIPERVLRGMPFFRNITFDYRVWLFVAAIALIVLTVCTLAPASRLSVTQPRAGLHGGTRSSTHNWKRFGSNLVTAELALAFLLLAAAGLLGKSFYRILLVDLNFNPAHLATLEVDANTGYETPARQLALSQSLLRGISEIPGVQSVGLSTQLPVTCNCLAEPYRVAGQPWNGMQQQALSRTVSSGYFATLQSKLLSGRLFSDLDDTAHPPVAIINESMAKLFFAGKDPIGQTIGDQTLSHASLHQVIGVVDDVREGPLSEPLHPAVYLPANQNPGSYSFVVARTAQDASTTLPEIAAVIHKLDPGIGVRNEFTMNEHIHDSGAYYLHDAAASLVGGFALCALVLSVIGLYGVVAYSVSQRTREIGVRMALGAQRSSIGRLILGEAMHVVLVGVGLGVSASFLLGHLLRSLLFGVAPWDHSIMAAVSLALVVPALAAAWLPAHRAAITNPVEALRSE